MRREIPSSSADRSAERISMKEVCMELEIRRNRNAVEVSLKKGMRDADAVSARKKLLTLVEEGAISLTVDISNLEYLDGENLATLVSIRKRCLQKGGEMTVAGMRDSVKELFEISRLDLVFKTQK
jgi:anti-sigma B factor antagonist